MGFLDKLLGREPAGPQTTNQQQPYQQQPYRPQDGDVPAAGQAGGPQPGAGGPDSADERAIGRYRYLLRTAPPEAIEKVHAEAFAQLTPEQRSQVLGQLSQDLPEGERPRSDDPQEMARAATRAEMRQPGYLQQSFGRGQMGGGRMGGGMGGGMGMGGMIGGSMLGGIAGVVVGSAIASSLFGGYEQSPEAAEAGGASDGSGGDAGSGGSGDAGGADASGQDAGGQDAGYADAGGSDPGAGFDSGGGSDFGGGFGGGDFGGGDF